MDREQQFVFAYGSLVQGPPLREAYLRGHRRTWGVAMENAVSLPGYKYYLDATDGSRPDVFVTFLDLVEEPGARVNGALLPVDAELLIALDRRERNYQRRDVTGAVELAQRGARAGAGAWGGALSEPGGPGADLPSWRVWTYFGKEEARRRAERGRRAERAVVHRAYLDGVRAGFATLADGALAEFEASTIPHRCRVLELSRIELE
jgi:gamma-glutamylcyclotransferase (GGCT)/AIG2-like uncharacterized protein YtfP